MKYTFEKGEKSTVKFVINVTAKEWAEEINLAYEKTKGKYSELFRIIVDFAQFISSITLWL